MEIWVLLGLGLLLTGLEIFVPGGVLGALGGLAIIAACAVAYHNYGLQGAVATFIGAALLVCFTVLIELKILARYGLGQRLFLKSQSNGQLLDTTAQAKLIGKPATTLTKLGPTGLVDVEGKHYEAFSRDGHMPKGESLEVKAVENFRLVVGRPQT